MAKKKSRKPTVYQLIQHTEDLCYGEKPRKVTDDEMESLKANVEELEAIRYRLDILDDHIVIVESVLEDMALEEGFKDDPKIKRLLKLVEKRITEALKEDG